MHSICGVTADGLFCILEQETRHGHSGGRGGDQGDSTCCGGLKQYGTSTESGRRLCHIQSCRHTGNQGILTQQRQHAHSPTAIKPARPHSKHSRSLHVLTGLGACSSVPYTMVRPDADRLAGTIAHCPGCFLPGLHVHNGILPPKGLANRAGSGGVNAVLIQDHMITVL